MFQTLHFQQRIKRIILIYHAARRCISLMPQAATNGIEWLHSAFVFIRCTLGCIVYCTQISDIFLQRIARIIRIFRRKRRRWPDAEQSEWQEPPRLKNPYNPCNPLWKNTSFSTTNKANNSNLPCGEKMYFPNAASGNEWNRMATLSIRFYSLHL